MAFNIESDGTYCSEAEKEDQNQMRRSKRLSQRNLLSSFRSNGDPIQRLYEIYQMLKCGELCSRWLTDDWQTLKFEVESIQKILKGKRKGRISFILKKINTNLQQPSTTCPNKSPEIVEPNSNDEQVKSPNILAGMMTEPLTEIPPYQAENLPEIINSVKNSEPRIALTQKNPLDLTKKIVEVRDVPDKILSQDISERQKQQPPKVRTAKRIISCEQRSETPTSTSALCISKDSMINLTEENLIETNRENLAPVTKERTPRQKTPVHVSKWFKFLPTQQRPKFTEKPSKVNTTTIAPSKNSKSLKDSIAKLYRDQPTVATSTSNTIHKNGQTSCPKKPKHIQKSNSLPIKSQSNECFKQTSFRNTETIITRGPDRPQITPRNVQSEHLCSISPDFLHDELLELSASDMNDSGNSLSSSLKEGLRKAFGTDILSDIFGVEKVYTLKENDVRSLATALKIEYGILKETIEKVLSNDGINQDDNMSSDSSRVECSQSPPQRLFPSQRSQT